MKTTAESWTQHVWVDFFADGAPGSAEADVVAVRPHEVVVVEVKVTGCRYGHEQLEGLYVPLLRHIYSRPVRGLQVCKVVNAETPGPYVDSIEDFLSGDLPLATWHWPGR